MVILDRFKCFNKGRNLRLQMTSVLPGTLRHRRQITWPRPEVRKSKSRLLHRDQHDKSPIRLFSCENFRHLKQLYTACSIHKTSMTPFDTHSKRLELWRKYRDFSKVAVIDRRGSTVRSEEKSHCFDGDPIYKYPVTEILYF